VALVNSTTDTLKKLCY